MCSIVVTMEQDVRFSVRVENVEFMDEFHVATTSKYKSLEQEMLTVVCTELQWLEHLWDHEN